MMKRSVLVIACACAFFAFAPAAGAVTFDGVCDLPGTTQYSKDLTLLPQDITWKFRIEPTAKCTGFVDGQFVVDTPAGGHVVGTGPISCFQTSAPDFEKHSPTSSPPGTRPSRAAVTKTSRRRLA